MLPWHRWRLYAVDVPDGPDGVPGLADAFNREPERFTFQQSAYRAAYFYEKSLNLPARFYVLPIVRHPTDMDEPTIRP